MGLNLSNIAKALIEVERVMQSKENMKEEWELKIFSQWWGNTSGGFEGIGGCAMIKQMTYVVYNNQKAYVFFGGRYAYAVKMNKAFKDDLIGEHVKGKQSTKEYELLSDK